MKMKEKNKTGITILCTIMMFVPWTILLIRRNAWALKSPVAEITIISYILFMIAAGIITVICYKKGNRGRLRQRKEKLISQKSLGSEVVLCSIRD